MLEVLDPFRWKKLRFGMSLSLPMERLVTVEQIPENPSPGLEQELGWPCWGHPGPEKPSLARLIDSCQCMIDTCRV